MRLIFENLIEKQQVAYIASVAPEGFPNLKAMLAPRKRNGIEEFWFTTNTSSQRVAQYRQNPKAAIYFCDPDSFQGIMLEGFMEVLEDITSKEMIWQDGDTIYYSGGVKDPDYCVLKFTAKKGRYYADLESMDFIPNSPEF